MPYLFAFNRNCIQMDILRKFRSILKKRVSKLNVRAQNGLHSIAKTIWISVWYCCCCSDSCVIEPVCMNDKKKNARESEGGERAKTNRYRLKRIRFGYCLKWIWLCMCALNCKMCVYLYPGVIILFVGPEIRFERSDGFSDLQWNQCESFSAEPVESKVRALKQLIAHDKTERRSESTREEKKTRENHVALLAF